MLRFGSTRLALVAVVAFALAAPASARERAARAPYIHQPPCAAAPTCTYYTGTYVFKPCPTSIVAPPIEQPAAPVLQPAPCPLQEPLYFWNDQIF